MIRTAILGSILFATACAPPPHATAPIPDLGSSKHVSSGPALAPGNAASDAPDPDRAARKAFQNPGGMWMPQQMLLAQHVGAFRRLGVQIAAATLADPLATPLAAIAQLTPPGCTASFVSPDGLLVTNHHCVQPGLEVNSTPEHNYVVDGFLAPTLADEKPAGPAQRVLVAQAFTDVTHDLRDGLEELSDPIRRKDELDRRSKQILATCEKNRPGIRCQVASFFGDGQYLLVELLELTDIRLVYAPARQVGRFGGETDNWGWPRHTGDWAFYRAYVGKDGRPAAPSPDNVPYQPKHWIKVTTAGVRATDFVMVAGYPGRTTRTQLASAIHDDLEAGYPRQIEYAQQRYQVALAHVKDPGETGIHATTLLQSIQNGLAKNEGIVAGFAKNPELMRRKDELDRRTKEWASQDSREDYKEAIDKLEALLAERRKTAAADFALGNVPSSSRLFGAALTFARWADERARPDADRRPGYQERDLAHARAAQEQLAKQYDPTLDRALLRLALVRALALPAAERPWLAVLLDAKKGAKLDEALIDRTLDAWYDGTQLAADAPRLDLLEHATTKSLAASTDPFVRAALRVWPAVKAAERKQDALAGKLLLVEPYYLEAQREALGGALAPDANGTLRISYGTVKSLHPDATDIADGPFTVASQIPAKNTGSGDFDAPKKLLDAIAAKKYGPYADNALGGELPVDFEADLDITGGNSGSPILNARGELVGLAFDGNREGLVSNVVFDGATTRSIQVDARYMLWTMDLLDGAQRLITEMGLTPKFSPHPKP